MHNVILKIIAIRYGLAIKLLLSLLLCLFPTFSLFNSDHIFREDWTNHLWMMGFSGQYFKHHLSFPDVFHSSRWVGLPHPVFYGGFVYSLLGVLGAFLGIAFSVKAFVYLVLVGTFLCVKRLFRSIGASVPESILIAIVGTWTIYSLTNLYHRGAIAEYLSICFLVSAVSSWLLFCVRPRQRNSIAILFQTGMFLVLMGTTHPITALYGATFFILITLLTVNYVPNPKRILLLGTALIGLMGSVSLPRVYATLLMIDHLDIAISFRSINVNPNLGDWYLRLFPFPCDFRSVLMGAGAPLQPDTPYLESQLNFPALLLGLAVWRKQRPSVAILTLALGSLFLFWLSVSPVGWAMVPKPYWAIQYSYRLVSYINLSWFGLLFLNYLNPQKPVLNLYWSSYLKGAVVALVVIGVSMKLVHAEAVKIAVPPQLFLANEQKFLSGLPEEFPETDYMTLPLYQEAAGQSKGIALYPEIGLNYGRVFSREVHVNARSLMQTNVAPFPWNRILVDGKETDPKELLANRSGLVVPVSPGVHQIGYQFNPDPLWVFLKGCSYILMAVWILVTAFATAGSVFTGSVHTPPLAATVDS